MVLIMLAFVLVATAASVRLGQWQLVEGPGLSAQYDAAIESTKVVETTRADIVDRDGVVLAKTSSFDQVVAHPDVIDAEDDESLVATLGALLDLNNRERAEYRQTLADGRAAGRKFVSLEPRITLLQSERILDAIETKALPGVSLESHDVRHYPRKGGEPHTSLASHLIGFVRADRRGGEGLERYYDEQLTTVDPSLVDIASVDAGVLDLAGLEPEPMELTIDAKLQKQVEKELYTVRSANKAKSVSAIVMDPHTGAIVAAASVPSYHAEDYAAIAAEDISILRNRVFQDQFEPGSVMKIFTATAALDRGVVTPNTRIRDEKELEFWKHTVRNADHDVKKNLTVKTAIAYSRNVATAKIARMLAPNSTQKAAQRLYGLWDKVGLVGRTGVDISGEASGMPYDPDKYLWAGVDLANRAFGQGASFTLPQLARGMATLVNGGKLIQPHLVAGSEQAQVKPERVITAKTARQAKDIMRYVTGGVPWYAKGSLIPGYDIGGKTGTAQIWDSRRGAWKDKRFNHSFVGFIGGRKQEYVIAVRLEEPVSYKKIKQGNIPLKIESYQAFQMVARATTRQLGMKKFKDPDAGRPIIGSDAAKSLTPERNRAAVRSARQAERKEQRQAAKAKTEKAKKRDDQVNIAADPAPDKGSSGGDA